MIDVMGQAIALSHELLKLKKETNNEENRKNNKSRPLAHRF